eukprot:c19714_g1_i1.p1 GENE.c19714_g1_i1~~c19714_g1_i1.p1  ORF type:complete len:619 (+),score=166.55 c19714_g1_i1:169-2025(+)
MADKRTLKGALAKSKEDIETLKAKLEESRNTAAELEQRLLEAATASQELEDRLLTAKKDLSALQIQEAKLCAVSAQLLVLVGGGAMEVPKPPGPALVVSYDINDYMDPEDETIDPDEREALCRFVSQSLASDPHVQSRLPLSPQDASMYVAAMDGVMLCKLVNVAKADELDERVVNTNVPLTDTAIHENVNLCLNSCKALGCALADVTVTDIVRGRAIAVHTVVWQLVRFKLLNRLRPMYCKEIIRLRVSDDEGVTELASLPRHDILMRWVHHLLKKTAFPPAHLPKNFSTDFRDCEAYIHLLNNLFPEVFPLELLESIPTARAGHILKRFQHRFPAMVPFVSASSIERGNERLCVLFLATLFSMRHGLMELSKAESQEMDRKLFEVEGDREAVVYTLWMNSLNVEPFVNNIFSDLRDGLILTQLFDKIKPGAVDWKRVIRKTPVPKFNRIQNTNYAIELAKSSFKFSLVGIDGTNLEQGHPTPTRALVWQMMRLHIDAMLSSLGKEINDATIITWANKAVKKSGKTSEMKSFKDPDLCNAVFLLDLMDAIRPGLVDYALVHRKVEESLCLANARYAISNARKLGATIFLSPEDIIEVKPKMIFTFVGSIMATTIKKS